MIYVGTESAPHGASPVNECGHAEFLKRSGGCQPQATVSCTGAVSAESWAGHDVRCRLVCERFEVLSLLRLSRANHLIRVLPTPQNKNHFGAVRANVQHAGAKAVDLVIDEGRDVKSRCPVKGNIDVRKLEAFFEELGRGMNCRTWNSVGLPFRGACTRRATSTMPAVEAILEVFAERDTLRPLEIVEAPAQLRHVTVWFRELDF